MAVIVLVELVGITVWLTIAPPARAHAPTTPCARVARVTDTTIDACRAARVRHAGTHRAATLAKACGIRTRMPRDLCAALGTTIVRDRHPESWATDRSLDELLRRESTWNPDAVNDRSDACGWFQRLVRHPDPGGGRGCPWPFVILGWRGQVRIERVMTTNSDQARNGLRYIAGRYRTPAAALRFHNRNGWY